MSHRNNILRIQAVYNALGDLQQDVIFVGGATVSLYADRRDYELEVRPTDDIDILVELYAYKGYAALEERLRSKGFVNDQESGIICRYKVQGITVDVMPTDEKVLGFSNRWYSEGYGNAIFYAMDERYRIKILSPSYFISCKLEAFKNRGGNDGRTSTDFEDIVFVFENRSGIWDEMKTAPLSVKEYLRSEFNSYLNNPFFEEWLDAHCGYGSPPATYYILDQLEQFVK